MKDKGGVKSEFSLMVVLLIPVVIAINLVGGQLASVLKLPVYLDAIGVVMISMIAGPWVGMTTGFVTNIILGLLDPFKLAYAPVQMAIGLVVGYLSKKGMFLKLWKSVICVIIVTLVTTITSSPITAYLFGGITAAGASMVTAVFMAAGQDILTAVFSSTFIVEIIDKGISVFVAIVLVKSMPPRYLIKFSNGMMYVKKKRKAK